MRLLISLLFIFFIIVAFGQKIDSNNKGTPDCILPVNCLTILNDKSIKPFITSGEYLGKLIIQARLDTVTMKLVGHKIIYADLHSKLDQNKKIEVRLDEHSGDIKYLDTILPDLIKHVKYLKFKIVGHDNCIMTTSWKLPITIT